MKVRFPTAEVDEERLKAWVAQELAELDIRPRDRNWRSKALGMTKAEAIASAPNDVRLDIRVPLIEVRILRALAKRRGLPLRTYVRRAIGTIAVVEGTNPNDLPGLLDGEVIGPRE